MKSYCLIELHNIPGKSIDNNILNYCLEKLKKEIYDNEIATTLSKWLNQIKNQKKYIMTWKLHYDLDETKYKILEEKLWSKLVIYYNTLNLKYMSIKKIDLNR